MNLRSWLRRVPHPHTLRLDDKKTLRISEGKNKWRDILDAVALEQPAKVEALDADGNVIRVTQLQDPDDRQDEAGGAAKPKSELAELGALIAGAYRAGAEQHAAAFQLAFAENTKLVGLLAERLGGLEKAWQTTLEQRAAELGAAGGEGGIDGLMNGPMGPLLQALAMKTLGSGDAPAKPAVAKTNGKK